MKADHKAAQIIAQSFKDGTPPWSTLARAHLELRELSKTVINYPKNTLGYTDAVSALRQAIED